MRFMREYDKCGIRTGDEDMSLEALLTIRMYDIRRNCVMQHRQR